jgi:hypothetical protein
MSSSIVIRTIDALDAIDLEIPPAGVVLTGEAARLQDATLALRDGETVVAGLEEYIALVRADRHDAANVQDLVTDLLPRLAALQAFLVEQVAEVTR